MFTRVFRNVSIISRKLFFIVLAFISMFFFLLIAMVNPSMKNPGPGNLSIFYQNVQGLIPFSSLGKEHPVLDRTKIFELNTVYFNQTI